MVQAKHWSFVIWPGHLNNKFTTLYECFDYIKDRTNGVKYLVMQHELGGEFQGHHIQGFVTFQGQKKPATIANHFGGILATAFQAMMRNSTPWANKVYCTKEDKEDGGRLAGTQPFEYGEHPTPNGKDIEEKTKLGVFIDKMKADGWDAAMDTHPETFVRHCNGLPKLYQHIRKGLIPEQRPVDVFVCWGTPGSGKSWWARSFDTRANTFAMPDISKKERLNIDGYNGERTLVIEDFDGNIEYRSLLRLLDIYKAQFNTKGGYIYGAWDTVIITSNLHPNKWYEGQDFWGEPQSPLQRRLPNIMHFTGVWPTAMVSINGGDMFEASRLHDREAAEAERDERLATMDAAAAAPAPVSLNEVPTRGMAETEQDILDDLLMSFQREDEAAAAASEGEANDFLRHLQGTNGLRFDRSLEGEQELEGEVQGQEPKGKDIGFYGFTG